MSRTCTPRIATALIAAALVFLAAGAFAAKPGGGSIVRCPKYSKAGAELNTCGCPTEFDDPLCDSASWALGKTVALPAERVMTNPAGEPYRFDITIDGSGGGILHGNGLLAVTNEGQQTGLLSSVVVQLEKKKRDTCAPFAESVGPSGKNWCVLGTAFVTESADCQAQGIARTCYHGEAGIAQSPGASLVLDNDDDWWIPSSIKDSDHDGRLDEDPICGIDNDGDGRVDEDPPDGIDNDRDRRRDEDGPDDDRDGRTDEDGICNDGEEYGFEFAFDVAGLGLDALPLDEPLRLNLMLTYVGAGQRGASDASCTLDANCRGGLDLDKKCSEDPGAPGCAGADPSCSGLVNESETLNVRTVRASKEFFYADCGGGQACNEVELVDNGAVAERPDCVHVNNSQPPMTRYFTESDEVTLDGTVTCASAGGGNSIQRGLDQIEGGDGLVAATCDHPGEGMSHASYWDCDLAGTATLEDGTTRDGGYDGWLVDASTQWPVVSGQAYDAGLVSSYAPAARDLVDKPQNLDQVNWIINQDFIGHESGCGAEGIESLFNYWDVQRAISELTELNPATWPDAEWVQCRVDKILAAAAFAEGLAGTHFYPGCDQLVAVILDPVDPLQVNIIEMWMESIPGSCDPAGTCTSRVCNTATLTCTQGTGGVTGSPAEACFTVSCPAP